MRPFLTLALVAALPATAQPRFEDLSGTLPPHDYSGGWEHFVGGGVAVFDCDADGQPEIAAAGGTAPAILLHNDGEMAFSAAPFPEISETTGLYPLDLDADGWLDLFVLRVGANVVLKGGPGCAFEDATASFGLPTDDAWSTAFTAWWEEDGRPVLAVGNYVDRADPEGPFGTCDDNAILRPSADGYAAEPLTPGFCALSILAARDARGRPTLRLSNDRHYYVREGHEQMWDIGERRFLTQADGWDGPMLWGMGIASRDLDGDGLAEVMLTSMGDQLLQIAQPDGTYANASYEMGTAAQRPYFGDDGRPSTGWHAEFGDVDLDGRPDLFIAKGNVDQMATNAMEDPNDLLMQRPDGTFVQAALEAGVASVARSRGAALADLDGDGDLDLVVVNRRAPMELYRNVTERTGHWLAVDLSQPGGNARAVGAVVTVETEAGRQVQEVTVGGGHAGGEALPLHFGLGPATEARVTIDWPDGTRTETEAAGDAVLHLARDP
ncbi:CRTAC1 family protein [Wenxinia marina]|uniref:ASPIC and UnbV/Family description n=1 Tax=Wenxinia marina DSM 24838 TaxID=1123501 RepID=A0A0D0NQ79_9RHOB|nr:CRTAC1 family protein [Wenxinia marina]KIQ70435.1 ASPIC and UnbV/Family description [Wenxinia marina DSM 24838]GGL53165.1 hypothetical protein GCM10011392_04420 [Wenxinia marina]